MSIEAMKQALEAMDECAISNKWYAAKDALQQAIEEAEKQEPIAGWYSFDESGKLIRVDPRAYPDAFKLYAATPAQKWVGLTDEEIYDAADCISATNWADSEHPDFYWHHARAIEAKLKEINE